MSIKRIARKFLPRVITRHRILGGPLKGQFLVTSWQDYPAGISGRTERPLLEWFASNVREGETWLDIGAHYGYTSIALSRLVGSTGKVFAFEPMVSSAGCICRMRSLNALEQLTVCPLALGRGSNIGVKRLPQTRGMVDSTLAPGGFEEHFLIAGLDWLWPQISRGTDSIDGIKIDVQGMEIDVLVGMADTLRRFKPKLAIELHRGVSRLEFLRSLADVGYTAPGVPIEPLTGESEPMYADDRSYSFVPADE